jgi:hypothetical protein
MIDNQFEMNSDYIKQKGDGEQYLPNFLKVSLTSSKVLSIVGNFMMMVLKDFSKLFFEAALCFMALTICFSSLDIPTSLKRFFPSIDPIALYSMNKVFGGGTSHTPVLCYLEEKEEGIRILVFEQGHFFKRYILKT